VNGVNGFFFGLYPYLAGTVFLLGSLARFERDPYTWKSDSSELLQRGRLRLGSNLFHVGILLLFLGHFAGLLTPHSAILGIGIDDRTHQILAMVSGGVFGALCLAGLVILIHRRLSEPRVRATTRVMDLVVLGWILITLLFGLSTLYFSARDVAGGHMIALAEWAQHIVTFRPEAAAFIQSVPLVFKIHLFLGMTLFALLPFSRLVHIWSGFASVSYLWRSYQVVRPRHPVPGRTASARTPEQGRR